MGHDAASKTAAVINTGRWQLLFWTFFLAQMTNDITFPILELTNWVFDDEKVFFGETFWDPAHTIKANELEKHYKRILVDSNGNILNVSLNKIIRKHGTLLPGIFQPTMEVELDLRPTGQQISLDDLKKLVLLRKDELFHITYNKLMTVNEFVNKVNGTTDFKDLITIASFGLD